MRSIVFCLSFFISIFLLISCSDDVKLYHPWEDPEVKWLLETVDYPDENPGFTSRLDQTFFYTDDDMVTKIVNPSLTDSLLKMDYATNKVSLSRIRKSGTSTITYDSIILKLNDKNQTLYALHVTYSETDEREKWKSNDDSTTFVYDAQGYMTLMTRYSRTSDPTSVSHIEDRKIENGNIVETVLTTGQTKYKYTYTYDDKEHAIPAEYCYEMPSNISALSGCWTFTNLPFLSEYLGKRSNNNVVRVVAERVIGGDSTPYGDITYKYTFDENDLVTDVEMSGLSKSNNQFENYITSFSYYKKEIY